MRWKDWGLLEEVRLEPLAIPEFLCRKGLETVICGLKLHLHFPYRRKCANQLCKSDEGLGGSREKNGPATRKGRLNLSRKEERRRAEWQKKGISTIMTMMITAAPMIPPLSCAGHCVQSAKALTHCMLAVSVRGRDR